MRVYVERDTGAWALPSEVYTSPGARTAVQLFVSYVVLYKRVRERKG
jgi:hypothetical protein